MDIELFTTTLQSVDFEQHSFVKELKRISKQTERYGYKGILVYSDNRQADPWLITGIILNETHHLLPMIALQPVYMHPYTVAKKIATLGLIYNRPIALNLVAGGFVNDLKAITDHTPHDKRYDRLAEYAEIIQLLLTSDKAITYKGEFYEIKNLKLQPSLPENLQPKYYLSGSSEMAQKTASRVGAKLIEYPEPINDYVKSARTNGNGVKAIRIGVLVRHSHSRAWSEAKSRFPVVRTGELTHQMAKKTSDSEWHKILSDQNGYDLSDQSVYWLGPFKQYHTFCPYLVGDFEEVAHELSGYLQIGCTTCILDIPVTEIDLQTTLQVFEQASCNLEKAY